MRTFNHPRLDFDLRFVSLGTAALTARLPAGERGCVRPLWDAASWAVAAERQRQHPQVGRSCGFGYSSFVHRFEGPGARYVSLLRANRAVAASSAAR